MARRQTKRSTREGRPQRKTRTGRPASSTRRRSNSSKTTTNHDEIRRWAEERGGVPACVQGTGRGEDTGIIRIEFPDALNAKDANLEKITWEDFFDKFDEQGLALVHQDKLARGGRSNFAKLVKRDRRSEGRRTAA